MKTLAVWILKRPSTADMIINPADWFSTVFAENSDNTVFHRNLAPDFEPWFVRPAFHGSMWWRLLHPPSL